MVKNMELLLICCTSTVVSMLVFRYIVQTDCGVHAHDGVLGIFPRGCCASSFSASFAFSV